MGGFQHLQFIPIYEKRYRRIFSNLFWIYSLEIRDLQIRLRLRVGVRVFQCVPGAHARLREAVTSTRSVVKISSPS